MSDQDTWELNMGFVSDGAQNSLNLFTNKSLET